MRIVLLCSSFNGLSQRVWTDLRAAGHVVTVVTTSSDAEVCRAVEAADPDLVLCPYLRERVPERIWRTRRTVIVHPGPVGDRGPSALDWAIADGARRWGVTAVGAVEEMDAGPVWGTRTFALPAEPVRKSTLYGTVVTEAAAALVAEVVEKAADPRFVPAEVDHTAGRLPGRLRPLMRQADRAFSWADPTGHVLRRIRAGDGSPGVRTEVLGLPVSVFDARPGVATPGEPGTVALRRHGSVLVRTGDGALWIGRMRPVRADPALPGTPPTGPRGVPRVKLPATQVLGARIDDVREMPERLAAPSPVRAFREFSYTRTGDVGTLRIDVHNGALSTEQCHRLVAALRHAAAQSTAVLVVTGAQFFSNGIHLNTIEAAARPAGEAWRNIVAIDDACREIITCTHQLVVVAFGGNAGAGGVMMGLGADEVLVRDGVVLNPHYRSMGLTGSEYWTYTLPRRVGPHEAERLTGECLPIGAEEAVATGLADAVLPNDRAEFEATVAEHAARLATSDGLSLRLAAKAAARAADEDRFPLEAYRARELTEMSHDMFDDRHDFAALRHAFVTKARPTSPTAETAVLAAVGAP